MAAAAVIDPAVVQAAAAGDTLAFGRVVDAYRGTICSIALAIVRDVPTSEDVAQDVFVTAWGRISELRNPDSIGPWLRQVARNRASDALRRRHRDTPADPAAADRAVADEPDPAEATLAAERLAVLHEGLEELPTDAREVLLLFYREGRSVRQVARLLGISEVTAKKRLSRARARLREQVLARFADAAIETGPRAAFTTAVISAITLGSPSVASAAAGGIAAAGGKLAKAALGGAAVGALLGSAGVVVGMRSVLRRARSDEERRALRRITGISVAYVIVLALVAGPLVRIAPYPITMWSWYVALVGPMACVYLVWVPRVIADRLQAERREDPTAARRQRRERLVGVLSSLFGAIAAGVATAYAISVST